ncbi:oxidoreductase [Rhodococcus opacus]|uniref:NADH-quinone oxidoreductase subunit B family protein n=1 Tax=Rhodococcus opacus TaxID=37919 RepID=UPI0007CD70BC|nr:oxidoreductase [Rhodococcus opacus]MDX5962457.1 oxidoreductase [Rhodococcus opacus]
MTGGDRRARGRGFIRHLRRIGRIAEEVEPAASPPGRLDVEGTLEALLPAASIQVRHIDTGSCNGCWVEINSALAPVHDVERYGIRLVASPRHADVLLVTGPVTRNMLGPLREAFEAMPHPKRVVTLNDCAHDCGAFAGGHEVLGAVRDVIPVDLEVPGCPPTEAIVAALRHVAGR